jgi:two-component system LytT family response regulator
VIDMLAAGEAAPAVARPFRARDPLVIKEGKRTVLVPVRDIDWIEATDYYARVHAAGKSYLMRESLKSLAESLDRDQFVRVHRSAVVNIERVREIEKLPSGDSVAVLEDGQKVRVSRSSSLFSRLSLHRSSPR